MNGVLSEGMHSTSRGWIGSLIFGIVFFFASLGSAAVLVFPAEVTNVEPGEGDAIVAVVADAFAEASGKQVTIVKSEGEAPAASYTERAKALGGTEYLVVRAVRLNEKVRVRVSLHGADGAVKTSESMTAISLDDMEPVAERLALALVQNTTAEGTRTHRNVTGKETRAQNRTFNEKVAGVKAQLHMPFASGVTIAPPVGLGFDIKLEADAYFLEFGAGFLIPTPSDAEQATFGGLQSELGASVYLTDSEVSLYAGGGAMPRILVARGGEGGANVAVYGQFGAMFARSSSSRFYTDLRVAQNITQVALTTETTVTDPNDPLAQPAYDVVRKYPTEIILEFGLGW
jgi:hypothetical protein